MKYFPIIACLLLFSCTKEKEKESDWITLFNGKDINDWIVKIHHHDPGVNFGETFRVEDDMIKVRYDKYQDFNDQFGHLYYKTPFSYFHLSLDYRFTGQLQQGAPNYTLLNSGVMFHSQDPRSMPKEQNWPISVEMQFLATLDDGTERHTGNMCSPGTDIVYGGGVYPDHCLDSNSKSYPREQWVHADLVVLGDSLVTHMINGDTVLQYSKPMMGGGVVNGYDSAIWKPGALLKEGYVALQSEGQPIDFKNIKIRKLR
ncbi:MAG TPA: DUF1080 domain-containing protein [Cyclobacteriaceae bacterium]|nr:DUF1080 domain-containing protein [Cyclobacteriaceae bacterium]